MEDREKEEGDALKRAIVMKATCRHLIVTSKCVEYVRVNINLVTRNHKLILIWNESDLLTNRSEIPPTKMTFLY